MDEPELPAGLHEQALAGLARVNWWSGSARLCWGPLRRLSRDLGRPLRVADIACGGGDVTLALANAARRAESGWTFAGFDLSPTALDLARDRAARRGISAEFHQLDALQSPLPEDCDALICSLFLHHLDESDAVALIGRLTGAARHLVVINDLERSRANYLLAVAASWCLTRSPVVHVDGPLSIAGAFTPSELRSLAAQAGCETAKVTRRWPCRLVLEWQR